MLRDKIAAMILAGIMVNSVVAPSVVLAKDVNQDTVAQEEVDSKEATKENRATISKFAPYYSEYREAYDKAFRMDNSNIKTVKSVGGRLREGVDVDKITDGDLNTYWETGKHTSDSFKNELIFTLNDPTVLNRVVYRSAGNKVGFAEDFEIWGSETEDGEDFKLVTEGQTAKTSDFVEIKFKPTNFKRIKFVFKNNGTATASEMMFYKEDPVLDEMNSVFTDNTLSKVSDNFDTVGKIDDLEKKAETHPLYNEYKGKLEDAKALIGEKKIESCEASVSKFTPYYSKYKDNYNNEFKMDNSNIESINSVGGNLRDSVNTSKIIDGDLNTYWETGRYTSNDFKNELIFTLKKPEVLNRIVYRSAGNTVGFAENLEIWASSTANGDTFQLVTTATPKKTADMVEIKFNPTNFKRIKFVFKNNGTATASEMMFYKEDPVLDEMNSIFTDNTLSKVSESFNTEDKLEALDEKAKKHPLYEDYKENIENAKSLLNQGKIEASPAKVSRFDTYYSNYIKAYDDKFRMPNSNIESVKSVGGNLRAGVETDKMLDGNLDTYWETGRHNSSDFNNELIFTLKEPTVLDRIAYRSAGNTVGFAENLEIWASTTTKGDTFQLVTTATPKKTADMIEIKFNPTNFKRIKFVFKGGEGTATASEMMFYKEDKVTEKVNSIFKDNTFSSVVPEYNSIEKLNELEAEIENHPLKDQLKEKVDLAKEIVSNKVDFSKNTFTLQQKGDIVAHARNDLKMSSFGTNLQSTGIVAKPGETFKVYVEAEEGKPLPQIVFTQQEGSYSNWKRVYNLHEGMNTIVVPEIYSSDWSQKSNKGGAVYLTNPYTPEQQGKAPVVRIDGGEHFPLFNEGDNVDEFLKELKDYKAKLDKNPDTMVDIFEFNADRLMFTGTASAAYKVYVQEGVNVNDSVNVWDNQIEKTFKYTGLSDNPSDVKNDSTNIRTTIRLMQPFGSAYAASDHIGLQRKVMDVFLRTDKASVNDIIWGTMHEVGHQLDIPARSWPEVTNNMWANYNSILNGKGDRINYEELYKTLAPEDAKRASDSVILEMFWQLELANKDYWPTLEKMYRENNPSVPNEQVKRDTFALYSSEILGMDLSPYFEKYNFILSDKCKEELKSKFKPMDKKLWYLNTKAMNYEGNGFNEDAKVDITSIRNNKDNEVSLSFDIDDKDKNDLLGYEILRDGKVIGFTSTNSFVDSNVEIDNNHEYEVIAYARDLSKSNPTKINSKTPSLSLDDKITLKLNEKFEPLVYANAYDYLGNKIDGVVVENNNVDTSKKGLYDVTYKITSNGVTVEKTAKVEVVSEYDYLSDLDGANVTAGYGEPRKNKDLKLFVNGEVKSFNKGFGTHANGEVVYNIPEDKNYDKFEAYLGVSRSIEDQNKSSIIFKVLADGKEIYNSGVMNYSTPAKKISLDIKGVKELKIIVNDANNGNSFDHAVIADPILTCNNVKPALNVGEDISIPLGSDYDVKANISAKDVEDGDLTGSIVIDEDGFNKNRPGEYNVKYSVTDKDGNETSAYKKIVVYNEETYLSDLNWKSARTDYNTVRKDKASTNVNIRLLVNGENKEFKKGIGTHANSEIVYDLEGGKYKYFETYVGVDRNIPEQDKSSVIFKIYADGKEVYNSGVMKYNTEAKFVRIPVDGVKELKLVANNANNGNSSDHADFADAKLLTVKSIADFSKLQEFITESATLNNLNYNKDTIEVYNNLIEQAKEVVAKEEATQEEVDELVGKIEEASKGLILRNNKVELEKMLEKAKAVEKGSYDEGRWEDFLWAIDYAEEIYKNPLASDTEVQSAIFTLAYIQNELK